jgi:L-alanine-DL-glutamate epimerase-like enolase superfamily enzyme
VGSAGGANVDADVRRVVAVHRALGDVAFIVDANQGYTRPECLQFVKDTQRSGVSITLLEQPLVAEDLEGLAGLRRDTGVPVAVDESARSLQDVRDVVRHAAADLLNIKIMKSGVLPALEMAAYARAAGVGLMIGGMVESRLAMGCSFAMVLGLGGYDVLDLDTPLLLAVDPVSGGYRYSGAMLVPWVSPGLGLEVAADPTSLMIIA